MKTVYTIITPEMAKEWLKQNTKNRNVSQQKVNAYAEDMAKGNWHEHHQGVAFYTDGTVADGQHRLLAVVKSGMSVSMMVTFDVPRESAIGIDVHRARKTNDVLRITGRSEWIGKDEAAIIKALIFCANRNMSTVSPSVVADFGEQHKDAILFTGGSLFTSTARYLTSAPIRAAAACVYQKYGANELLRFSGVLISGIMETPDDVAAIRLRERLMLDGPALGNGSVARIKAMKLTMRAMKAFFECERIGKLIEPSGFIYPILGAKQ